MSNLAEILLLVVQTLYSGSFRPDNGAGKPLDDLSSILEMRAEEIPVEIPPVSETLHASGSEAETPSPNLLDQKEKTDPRVISEAMAFAAGVNGESRAIDRMLGGYIRGWKLDRLGIIELLLLRSGIWLLKNRPYGLKEVTAAVLEVASAFGLDQALNLLGGVLEAWSDDQKNGGS